MARKKQTVFARNVPGLTYQYPFKVGDICYFRTATGEVLTRQKKIITEIGIPIEVGMETKSSKDLDGHVKRENISSGNFVEGVRVKYDDGFSYTLGYQTNIRVTNLIKVDDYEKQLG